MKKTFLVLTLLQWGFINAYAPVNFFRPYDVNWKMNDWKIGVGHESKLKLGGNLEYGTTTMSRSSATESADLLSIYQDTQSSIAMLLGAPSGSAIEALALEISPATDDGIRGRIRLARARYKELSYTLYAQQAFEFESISGKFYLTGYLPLRDMSITGVDIQDQTLELTSDDLNVKAKVTNDLVNKVKTLGGLDITDWKSSGIGDAALMLTWQNDFKQEANRNIENVRLSGRIGLTIPTGKRQDVDKAFSLPFGHDGTFAIPCMGSIDMFFKDHLRFGLELEFTKFFDETRLRRLKTDSNQTDFLLLNKGRARKNYGTTWKFNVFLKAEHFIGGLSTTVIFQNAKKGNDVLHSKSHAFDHGIINSAQSLGDWTYNNLIFKVDYDFHKSFENALIKPQISAFYKIGLAGKRYYRANTFGGQIAFNF